MVNERPTKAVERTDTALSGGRSRRSPPNTLHARQPDRMEGTLKVVNEVDRLSAGLNGERKQGHAAKVEDVPGLLNERLRRPEDDMTRLEAFERALFGDIDSPSFEGFVRWTNSLRQSLKLPEDDPRPIFVVSLIESAKDLTPEMISHLKGLPEDLRMLSPDIFEQLVGELLCFQGFEDVRLVGRDSSTAADIFAAKKLCGIDITYRLLIEVKRHKKRIGIEVINQVVGAMVTERARHGWHSALIVSLSGFKSLKRESPEGLSLQGIELKEGADIVRWLDDYSCSREGGLWLCDPKRYMPRGACNSANRADGNRKRHGSAAHRA